MGMDQNNSFTPAFFTSRQDEGCAGCEVEYAAPRQPKGRKNEENYDSGEAHIYYDACDGVQSVCLSTACQEQLCGRVLNVTATLRNVCPGRRSAVGLTLSEVDEKGTEHARGFRAISVPAHHGSCSRDIQLDAVRFVLPEEMSLQSRRHFICRMDHHYLDSGEMWG